MQRLLLVALAALALAGAGTFYSRAAAPAQAHGKEVQIDLRCAPADPAAPLDQSCEAVVTFANDAEPVSDARLTLEGVRPGKGDRVAGETIEPTGEPGHYAGTIRLSAYGTWILSAQVEAPAEGKVDLRQEVLPPSGTASPVAQVRARLLISFNGRDIANIAALIAHLLGTLVLFAATAAVLVVGGMAQGLQGADQRKRVARWFPRLAGASLALIAASGFYNALYNSPTSQPGLLHPGDVASLPFGDAYLIAFGVKMLLAVALTLGTAMLAFRLRRSASWLVPRVAGGAQALFDEITPRHSLLAELRKDACVLWAATNLLAGGALLIDVVVLDYLHLLSHAGALSAA